MWISKVRAGGAVDRSAYGSFWFEPVGRLASSGVRVTPASALALPAVWAAVRVLSESFAILPFTLKRPKVGGGRTNVTNHWLYRLFAKAPNQFQSPYEFREMLQGHLALRGNCFCQITPDGQGGVASLLPLHPDRVRVELLPDGNNYRYIYTDPQGNQIPYTRGEIWHVRGLSSDGYMGMSPIEVARESVGEGLAMQDYSARFFANDSKPGGGWIEMPGKFADTATKQTFRESWQQMQGGANRGKVAVLEGGMKFHELGLSNKDSQFVEARAAKVTDIARIFRVQPHKIGDLSQATFSNIEQQSIEFWQDTMLPWSERWESSIEFQLLGPDTDLEVEFDMRRMMRGDATARGAYYTGGINAGWLTRNEARSEEGLDPINGLDEPLRPLNMVENDDAPEPDEDSDPTPPVPPALPTKSPAESRLHALVQGNAARMARRIVAGPVPTPDVLADALAIDVPAAQAWLDLDRTGRSQDDLAASLTDIALKGTP